MTPKEPWLAVNLSMFFPGIGQIYAGESWRGLIFILTQVVLIAIAVWSLFSPAGNTVLALGCSLPILVVYIVSLYDAHACVKKQFGHRLTENLPRINKDPWFAVFLSRILPGFGQLYIEKITTAAILLASTIIFSTLANFLPNLFIFLSIISAFACYHAYAAFPKRKRISKPSLIAVIAVLILAFRLIGSSLPTLISQQFEIFVIPSNSMMPTLQVGDRILVIKSSLLPKQGDLIVFKEPEFAKALDFEADKKKQKFFIKRVIGTPGQLVRVTGGVLYVNDSPLQEAYIKEPLAYEWKPPTVPVKSYLVLGDNRNNSFDSHVWGFLPARKIVGKAYKIYWPPERIRSLF